MVKKITLYVLLLFSFNNSIAQVSNGEDEYNGFSSRSFMKFNGFLTNPTFSVLYREDKTFEAIIRSANIDFEDAARLNILSYSGKMRTNTGAGIAVFQQDIGVFKDFGAIVNYAHQIKMGAESSLTFGFNFFYSRRSINNNAVITQGVDEIVSNFQDIPIVNFQPAITYSYGKFFASLFFENLADFHLKKSEFITPFGDKTIAAHFGYGTTLKTTSGLLKDTNVRFLGVARRSKADGFSYAGNAMVNLPKAGWLKVGYDNLFGLNAGFGVNLSDKLSIGLAYEKRDNLGGTNEIGLLYKLGRSRGRSRRVNSKPRVEIVLPNDQPVINDTPKEIVTPEYEDPEHNDLSDEVQRAQDSINVLNKKVEEILNLLKNQPKQIEVIREVKAPETPKKAEVLDTSLRRSTAKPWRKKTITRRGSGGGAGTMYYVAVDQFKARSKALALVKSYKKRKITVKTVRDPKSKFFYVYVDRYSSKAKADKTVDDVNGGREGGREGGADNEIEIQVEKSPYKDPVYAVKITLSAAGETYTEPKSQPRARVRTMAIMEGLDPGYYLQVNVYSKKAYADKFLEELRNDNINADYFLNPKTGNRHVYIHSTNDRAEIIRLYNNNLNNSYYDRKSIIHIR